MKPRTLKARGRFLVTPNLVQQDLIGGLQHHSSGLEASGLTGQPGQMEAEHEIYRPASLDPMMRDWRFGMVRGDGEAQRV